MKFVNVRHLTRNLEEATAILPVTVTKFGQPIFKIVPISSEKPKESVNASNASIVGQACHIEGCYSNAEAVGRIWDKMEQDYKEVPMCKKHAVKSLKEII